MFPRGQDQQRTVPEAGRIPGRVAVVLGILWAVGVLVFAVLFPPAGGTSFLTIAMTLLVVLLPLALIWLALVTLRTVQELRAETAALQAALEVLRSRDGPATGARPAPGGGPSPPPGEPRPETGASPSPSGDIRAPSSQPAARAVFRPATRTAAALAPATPATPAPGRNTAAPAPEARERSAPATARDGAPGADTSADEPALALEPDREEARPAPLTAGDVIRALQFPDSAEDTEGVRALHRALEDHELARLIRAAQDVLTLLSQEGVYMDDLEPDAIQASAWRLFAAGSRGEAIAAVGAIRDRAPLGIAAARMREDAIFRDAAHHFLRAFDRSFQNFEKAASDAEIADLAQTRTARAFMLCGRVAGVFD